MRLLNLIPLVLFLQLYAAAKTNQLDTESQPSYEINSMGDGYALTNNDSTFKHGISLAILGTGFPVGISYGRFIGPKDMLEVGVGLGYVVLLYRPSFGVSYKHYFKEVINFKPSMYLSLSGADILSPLDTPGPFISPAYGISFYTKKIYADIHLGPTILPNESWIVAIYGGLNLGLRLN